MDEPEPTYLVIRKGMELDEYAIREVIGDAALHTYLARRAEMNALEYAGSLQELREQGRVTWDKARGGPVIRVLVLRAQTVIPQL